MLVAQDGRYSAFFEKVEIIQARRTSNASSYSSLERRLAVSHLADLNESRDDVMTMSLRNFGDGRPAAAGVVFAVAAVRGVFVVDVGLQRWGRGRHLPFWRMGCSSAKSFAIGRSRK